MTVQVPGVQASEIALAEHNVTVLTQPGNRTCTVSNGTETVGATDVTSVLVTCTP